MRLNLSSLMGKSDGLGQNMAPANEDIIDAVRWLYIFEWLDRSALALVVSNCTIQEFDPLQVIFAVGDPAEGNAYILLSGEVEITMGDSTASASARGMLLGGNALVSSDPRNHTVRTTKKTRCLVVNQDIFISFASEHYDLNKVMYRAFQRDFDRKNPADAA